MTEEEVWEVFWKKIILNDDGTINLKQLKKELFGYSWLLDQSSTVYSAITGNRIKGSFHSSEEVLTDSIDFINAMIDVLRESDKKVYDQIREDNIKLIEQMISVE